MSIDRDGRIPREITLRDVLDVFGRRKRTIIGGMTFFLSVGLLYAIFATPIYTATATVKLAGDEDGSLGVSGQLASAASLAGINLGGGGSNSDEYFAILKSRGLAERFIREEDVLPSLFPTRWDQTDKRWRDSPPGMIRRTVWAVQGLLAYLSDDQGWSGDHPAEPTMWRAYMKFDGQVRNVTQDEDTGIVTVSFDFPDPRLAAKWVNDYLVLANDEIRERTIDESTRAVAYLEKEAAKTNVAGLRETIYGLVETQMKQITLANARPDFAFRTIDSAVVPEKSSRPKRFLIIVLSAIVGVVFGAFSVLLIEGYKGTLSGEPSGR